MKENIDCLERFEEKAKKCILDFFEEENVLLNMDEEKEMCSKIRNCAKGYFAGKKSPHSLMSEEKNYAVDICAIIEDILEEKDITIPDEARDDYDEEELARLFGEAYYEMEDSIASLFEEVKAEAMPPSSIEQLIGNVTEKQSDHSDNSMQHKTVKTRGFDRE